MKRTRKKTLPRRSAPLVARRPVDVGELSALARAGGVHLTVEVNERFVTTFDRLPVFARRAIAELLGIVGV